MIFFYPLDFSDQPWINPGQGRLLILWNKCLFRYSRNGVAKYKAECSGRKRDATRARQWAGSRAQSAGCDVTRHVVDRCEWRWWGWTPGHYCHARALWFKTWSHVAAYRSWSWEPTRDGRGLVRTRSAATMMRAFHWHDSGLHEWPARHSRMISRSIFECPRIYVAFLRPFSSSSAMTVVLWPFSLNDRMYNNGTRSRRWNAMCHYAVTTTVRHRRCSFLVV